MKKAEVLAIIDEVMNNREIDSIRNAILAIRDRVKELEDDEQSEYYARLKLRGKGPVCFVNEYYDGAEYLIVDTAAKIDTGIYGCIQYDDGDEHYSDDEIIF